MPPRRSESSVRSGRFSTAAAGTVKLVDRRSRSYYRFFNSSTPDANNVSLPTIELRTLPDAMNNTESLGSLSPGSSVDIPGDNGIQVVTSSAAQGIYDHLDPANTQGSGRSGRFHLRINPNTQPVKIIDLNKGGPNKQVYYRILNSGDNAIQVLLGTSPSVVIATILKGHSYDLMVNSSGGNNKRDIYVRSTANTLPISGVYECIGSEA